MEILIAIAAALIIGLQLYAIFRPKTSTSDDQALHAQIADLTTRHAVATEAMTRVEANAAELRSRLKTAEESSAENLNAAALLRTRLATVEEALDQERHKNARLPELEANLSQQSELKNAAQKQLGIANEALARVETAAADLRTRLKIAEGSAADSLADNANLRTRIATVEQALDQERKQSAEADERLRQEFKLLANDVMKSHSESFTKQNKDQIDGILTPLKEKLGEFQTGLVAAQTESAKDRATMAEQIRTLSERSVTMTLETSNLTKALKGESQTQGAWGEMILSSILEKSGLREGEEYFTQEHHTNEAGQRLRSDVIVKLPGDQNRMVIDSKLSLTAFEEYVNAESDFDRAAALKRHTQSVRNHIKTLAGKEYQSAAKSHLDYVVMFIPIEGALPAALQGDKSLISAAVDANVMIATPTVLMIALRTVAGNWQVERRNQNAQKIADQAAKIHDKLVGFLTDMANIGNRLAAAQAAHSDAMGKLSTGRGNLVNQVASLKKLGVTTHKSIPSMYLDEPEAEDTPPEIAASAGA